MVKCTQPPPLLKLPESKITELKDDENHDSLPKPEKRTKMHHIERHKSCVVTLSDIELNGLQPYHLHKTIDISKITGGSQCSLHEETPTDTNASHSFRGQPIGTVSAVDKSQGAALNYDQVFMRGFIPSALAFLMKGKHLIVKNFLIETARLQSREKIGQGVMPASFKVHHRNPTQKTESLLTDFGETDIGRVAPVDSGVWWIILLCAYTEWTGDNSLAESPNCQRAMDLILWLCVSEGCDTSPALLCADGCSMIDRRMGICGYPIEIQALFFMAVRCALSLLKQESDADFVNHITKRIQTLSYHLHTYCWLDFLRLDDIYRYKTEEYSQSALNKFNAIPESIPDGISDFLRNRCGYFIGNVSPARMDICWFCLGNLIAILSSLATGEKTEAILNLVEELWQELIGEMPLKICYSAMENQEWQIVTGCDPKNTRWSYHNGGSWPVLMGRLNLARKTLYLMEQKLAENDSPEHVNTYRLNQEPRDTNSSHNDTIYNSHGEVLNYDQISMRDFVPSTLAFLVKGEMPRRFKVHHRNPTQKIQTLLVDFGETAMGRVAPVDSGLWLIILLRDYTKWIGVSPLSESPNCQRAMHLLKLSLWEGCDTSPALLCADGCSRIGRRVGIYGYPNEFQALFFMAVRCSLSLLKQESDADCVNHITKRIQALSYHLHFIGNVSPARMDFRWFCLGNFIAILSLATTEKTVAILDLVEERWQELIGEMLLKICYPAMENQKWQVATGCDMENTRWSSHNGGSQSGDYSSTVESDVLESDVLFSEIIRKVASRWVNEKGPKNVAVISLDDLDKFLETYVSGIGQLRQYCEINGIRKDLSKLGYNKVIFTTLPPPGGTFYFNIEYQRRILRLVLDGRNLYLMGWQGPHGIFELNDNSLAGNYMSGNDVTVIHVKKNYRFLAPREDVKNVRIGFLALREAFEKMYKSKGKNNALLESVATFAVHFPEAGRIQSIFKDICITSNEFFMDTLDHRNKYNSLWINNYAYYGRRILKRIIELDRGEVPKPIRDCSQAIHLNLHISEADIISQIRIFLWDPELSQRSASKKRSQGGGDGDGGFSSMGRDVESSTLPLYLVEDWRQPQEESKGQMCTKNEEILSAQWIKEFLDVFPAVKKFVPETDGPGLASKFLPATQFLPISSVAALRPVSPAPSGSSIKLLPLSTAPPLPALSPGNLARMSPVEAIGRKLTHPRLVMAATRLIRLLI